MPEQINDLQDQVVKTIVIKLTPATHRRIRIMAATEDAKSVTVMAAKLLDAAVAHIK